MNIPINIEYHKGQQAVFNSKAKKKFVIKGRRWGFTKGCAIHLVEQSIDGVSPFLWVDTVNTNIDRYVERYFVPVLKQMPQHLWKWRQQKKELRILNSVIDFRSADQPENIEGFGYKKIILNEAGIILKKRYIWDNAITPMMIDYDADIIAGGTPKGPGLYKELSIKGNDAANKDWETFHFTTYDNRYLDKKVIDNLASKMPELVRRQEIYAEFIDEVSAVFKNIGRLISSIEQAPVPGETYYVGVDLAKHVDFTVITVLNSKGQMVYFKRINKVEWGTQKQLIFDIVKLYNNAKTLIDSTGVGDPIFDDLKKAGLNIEGYKFTSTSKNNLIESLMMAFEMEKIAIMNVPELIDELGVFSCEMKESTKTMRYNAPEGYHDDCVISLALAYWCFNKLSVRRPQIWSP